MSSFTVRIGVLLVVLGVASYVTTGAASVTALIPALVGAVLALCGAVARRSSAPRPLALQVAIGIAIVGLLGTITALGRMGSVLMGDAPARPALVARASMALILLVYVAVALRAAVRGRSRA